MSTSRLSETECLFQRSAAGRGVGTGGHDRRFVGRIVVQSTVVIERDW
jgi:hypothetical protein